MALVYIWTSELLSILGTILPKILYAQNECTVQPCSLLTMSYMHPPCLCLIPPSSFKSTSWHSKFEVCVQVPFSQIDGINNVYTHRLSWSPSSHPAVFWSTLTSTFEVFFYRTRTNCPYAATFWDIYIYIHIYKYIYIYIFTCSTLKFFDNIFI